MQTRFVDFERRLVRVEGGVQRLLEAQLDLEQEAGALREHMAIMCLEMVVDLTEQAVDAAMTATSMDHQIEGLHQVQGHLRSSHVPLATRCFAAYDTMHTLHEDCHCCSPTRQCPLGSALLQMRDLVVMAACVGRGPLDASKIKACLEEAAVAAGCRTELSVIETSVFILSFSKIYELGNNRMEFERAVRSSNLYGPRMTAEQSNQLYFVYNSVSRASPKYLSMNHAKKKKIREERYKDKILGVVRPPLFTTHTCQGVAPCTEEVDSFMDDRIQREWLEAEPQLQAEPTTVTFWQPATGVLGFHPEVPFGGGAPPYYDNMPSCMLFQCVMCMSIGQEGVWRADHFVCSSCTNGAASSSGPIVPPWL
jgi:hypothetical protein